MYSKLFDSTYCEIETPNSWSHKKIKKKKQDLPNPGVEPRSPKLQVDSLPAEPQGKIKNTGVGSLSLLQRIVRISPGSNWGLLHCRQILYQLSYLGSHLIRNDIYSRVEIWYN